MYSIPIKPCPLCLPLFEVTTNVGLLDYHGPHDRLRFRARVRGYGPRRGQGGQGLGPAPELAPDLPDLHEPRLLRRAAAAAGRPL